MSGAGAGAGAGRVSVGESGGNPPPRKPLNVGSSGGGRGGGTGTVRGARASVGPAAELTAESMAIGWFNGGPVDPAGRVAGACLHSSTSHLYLGRFCH